MDKHPATSSLHFLKRICIVMLPALLSVALFAVAFFVYIIPPAKQSVLKHKKEQIQYLINTVHSMIGSYETQVKNGVLSRVEAEARALNRVRSLRFGANNKNYFWVLDSTPRMISHPYRSDLIGRDLSDFTDINGKKFIKQMTDLAKQNGDGWVTYQWQWLDDKTRVIPKLSYVKMFKPWGWIIGSGIYIEDVEAEMWAITRNILILGVGILVLVLLLGIYLAWRSVKSETRRLAVEQILQRSEMRYRASFDLSPVALWEMDVTEMAAYLNRLDNQGGGTLKEYLDANPGEVNHCSQLININDMNAMALTWHGSRDIVQFKQSTGFFSDKTWSAFQQALIAFHAGEDRFEAETVLLDRKGNAKDVILRCSFLHDTATGFNKWLMFVEDITETKQQRDMLEDSYQQIESTLEHAQSMALMAEIAYAEMNTVLNAATDGICVIGEQQKIIRVNEAFASIVGIDPEDAKDRRCYELFKNQNCNQATCPYHVVKNNPQASMLEVNWISPQGQNLSFEAGCSPYFGLDGSVTGIVICLKDITERKRMADQLLILATTDSLTGLLNRRRFIELAIREVSRARRYEKQLGFIALDIDHFKNINDTYGHPAGDEVLKQWSAACRDALRLTDLLGRVGGEEFAVLVVESDLQRTLQVAERIRGMTSQMTVVHEQKAIELTISLGVAQLSGPKETLDQLIKRADQALYQAKETGRNKVVVV